MAQSASYWIVKQEPSAYSFAQFMSDQETAWTGVRNFQARNHLRAMAVGDHVLFYHTGDEKAVVGTARVSRAAYPDPSADAGDWVSVDLRAGETLADPVTLARIKRTPELGGISLVRNSRLSVLSITESEYKSILRLAAE